MRATAVPENARKACPLGSRRERCTSKWRSFASETTIQHWQRWLVRVLGRSRQLTPRPATPQPFSCRRSGSVPRTLGLTAAEVLMAAAFAAARGLTRTVDHVMPPPVGKRDLCPSGPSQDVRRSGCPSERSSPGFRRQRRQRSRRFRACEPRRAWKTSELKGEISTLGGSSGFGV